MDLSFNGKMEAYYQKFIELQEKLRNSEEERLKLEMKFNEMLQITREEEQAHYKKLRSQYKRFLEEDKKRQERNERIVRTLERIEARVNMLTSRTDRFKMLKRQYQTYIQRISHIKPIDKTEHSPSKDEEEAPSEQRKDMPDHSSLKKAMGKSNEEKIKILDMYLQSLANQKYKDTMENEEKDPQSDVNQLRYLDNVSKNMENGFNSNQANSIAEDIMNSIYSRHYNRDLVNDDTKKANKITTSKYLNDDVPLKQNTSDFGDSYNADFALDHLDTDAAIGKDFMFDASRRNLSRANFNNIGETRNNSEFDILSKNKYKLKDNIPESLNMYNKQDIDREKRLENRPNMLSTNKDYYIEKDPLVKCDEFKGHADLLLKKEYKIKDFIKNDSKYLRSNQNQSVDSLLKTIDPDDLLKEKDHPIKKNLRTNHLKVNQTRSQVIDPLSKCVENKDKPGPLVQLQHQPFKNFTPDFDHDERVKFEKFKDGDISYGPSKNEIDIIENEKRIVADNYLVPSGYKESVDISNDICDKSVQQHEQDVIQKKNEYEQSKEHYDTEFPDNEINNRDTCQAEHENYDTEFADNKIKNGDTYHVNQFVNESGTSQHHELFTTKQEIDSYSVVNNEVKEIGTTIPDEQLDHNKVTLNKDNAGNEISQLALNSQHNSEDKKKVDIQSNEEIQEECTQQYTNEDQPQYVEDQGPIQYNQYEEPIRYDQFGNQIMYDESGEEVSPQYDENGQPYNQIEPFDEVEQQHYDENRENMQYDESGQPIQSYEQQYDADGQPILYDQQYVTSDQPVQQYDENGQVFQQYDQISHPMQYDEKGDLIPQYDENGQLIQQYDASGQPIHLYHQSDQPIEYEKSQPVEGYEDNEPLTEQYRQDGKSVQEYEQPFELDGNEQPVEQYNQDSQLVQEYEQSFQQYDANGQFSQQYDENGQPIQQYDEHGQPIQQYDEHGQPIQQYDENGQPIQQYDENGQPIQQYDENGQPIYQYNHNVQSLQQYDENGQLIDHYDKHNVHQYNKSEQPPEKFNGEDQPIQQHGKNIQDVQTFGTYDKALENLPETSNIIDDQIAGKLEDKSKVDLFTSTVKEDISNTPMVEGNRESRPAKQKNVLDMLDTDTESVKQNTSKISNDSDFDFSNG